MSAQRYLFKRKQRLTSNRDFTTLYSNGFKSSVGPLLIHRHSNGLPHSRLGLSIPKKVGNAKKRNSIKRLCREAFRLSQYEFPLSVDVLITIRPHQTASLSEYKSWIALGVESKDN